MSEHSQVQDLLGPYVMGALEPEEEHEVEEHLEGCVPCREEARDLRLVHERLADLANATQTPPTGLKARVMTGMPRRRTRRVPLVAAAAAVLCVLVVLGVLFASGIFGQEEIASATLEPTGLAPGAGGEIQLYESGSNVRVELEVWGMPESGPEEYYELWFVEDGEHMSGGGFTVGPDGRLETELNAPSLAKTYPQVGVTSEKDTGDPRPSDKKMLGGELRKL
jgi:hypothetical protein